MQEPSQTERDRTRTSFHPGERNLVWIIWLTYGAFYFCRTNISVAVPGMGAAVDDGGLG